MFDRDEAFDLESAAAAPLIPPPRTDGSWAVRTRDTRSDSDAPPPDPAMFRARTPASTPIDRSSDSATRTSHRFFTPREPSPQPTRRRPKPAVTPSFAVTLPCTLVLLVVVILFVPAAILLLMPEESSEAWITYSAELVDTYRRAGGNVTTVTVAMIGPNVHLPPQAVLPRDMLDTLDTLDHLAPLVAILQINGNTILPTAASYATPRFRGKDDQFVPLPRKHQPHLRAFIKALEQRMQMARREEDDSSDPTELVQAVLFSSLEDDSRASFTTVFDLAQDTSDMLPHTTKQVCMRREGASWVWLDVGVNPQLRQARLEPWITQHIANEDIPDHALLIRRHNHMRAALIPVHEFDENAQRLLMQLLPLIQPKELDEFEQTDLRMMLLELECVTSDDDAVVLDDHILGTSHAVGGSAPESLTQHIPTIPSPPDNLDRFPSIAPLLLPPSAFCSPSAFLCFGRLTEPGDQRELMNHQRGASWRRIRRLLLTLIGITEAPARPIQREILRDGQTAARITILTSADDQAGGERLLETDAAMRALRTRYVVRRIHDFTSRSWVEQISLLAYTDILIAPAGASLSLSWALPKGGIIVECTSARRASANTDAATALPTIHADLRQQRIRHIVEEGKPGGLVLGATALCAQLAQFGVICD